MRLMHLVKKGLVDLFHSYTFDVRPSATVGGLYYLDVSEILAREIRGFEQSIPTTQHANVKYYNPVTIGFYALHLYEKCLIEKDEAQIERFLKQASWLKDLSEDGAPTYSLLVPRYSTSPGWKSAMAQGLAISVFTRAFQLTRDPGYLDAALRAAAALARPIEVGGCSSFDQEGLPFLEEIAANPPAHILNGAIFALWGLYDLEEISNVFQSFKELVTKRLIKELPHYDITYWSRYDLRYQAPASRGYHILHISQLKVLHKLTGDPIFKYYADKWQSYLKNPLKRIRAFWEKAWFSIKEGQGI